MGAAAEEKVSGAEAEEDASELLAASASALIEADEDSAGEGDGKLSMAAIGAAVTAFGAGVITIAPLTSLGLTVLL